MGACYGRGMTGGRHPHRGSWGSRPSGRSLALLLLLCVAARASDTPTPEGESPGTGGRGGGIYFIIFLLIINIFKV